MEINTFIGKNPNVFKYVFSQKDYIVEAVLYRYLSFNKRTVICCSVMSGCPVGCVFCGTGKRFIRNLTSKEIVFQIQYILKKQKINTSKVKKLQIMFMSMGEPMLNWENTKKAIFELNNLYPKAELLISTIGINDNLVKNDFIKISQKIKTLGIQFSIHEYNDKRRNKIMPYLQKMTLKQIAEYGKKWYEEVGRQPFLNYIVSQSNGNKKAAFSLKKTFDPDIFQLTLSVLCKKNKKQNTKIDEQLIFINKFKNIVSSIGFKVRVFNPAGQDDIGGGCGQLWFVQEKLKDICKND